mgnify:CR=1 FL=1
MVVWSSVVDTLNGVVEFKVVSVGSQYMATSVVRFSSPPVKLNKSPVSGSAKSNNDMTRVEIFPPQYIVDACNSVIQAPAEPGTAHWLVPLVQLQLLSSPVEHRANWYLACVFCNVINL